MKHKTTTRISDPSLRSRRVSRRANPDGRTHGRSGLAALQLSIAALFAITLPDSLMAAPDAGTPLAGVTMTFSGNQSAGIASGIDFTIPPTITIHVQALTLGIAPAAGTAGIYMAYTQPQAGTGGESDADDHAGAGGSGAGGFTLTLSYDGSRDILTSASGIGINFQSNGGAGGTGGYSPRATLNPGGNGGVGGVGGNLTLTTDGGLITTSGDAGFGIFASSAGGKGGDGGGSDGSSPVAGNGNTGGNGGTVNVTNHTNIVTSGGGATGIFAQSVAGKGGTGGYASGDLDAAGGSGGVGGTGGHVTVDNYGNITTSGDYAQGILAQSVGGAGGNGGAGDGFFVGTGGAGLGSGPGGNVEVTNRGRIETFGVQSNGLLAQSIGGFAGSGGASSGLIVAFGGGTNSAGAGGVVNVTTTASSDIITHNTRSYGIIAQSVGGGGGAGGSGSGLVGFGGSGSGGGAGGAVNVNAGGQIHATGANSIGIFAQSVGGGGGDGGTSGGLFSVGGNGSSTSPGDIVRVANNANITSTSNAILAQSVGGGGGNGGSSGGWFSFGGSGGGGGAGGSAAVTSSHGDLATSEANASAIFVQSVGGGGGNGGNSVAVGAVVSVAIGGNGAAGGAGGVAQVGYNPDTGIIDGVTGTITTTGDRARGIQAQSVGGGGGNGGFAASVAVSTGASVSLGIGGTGGGGGKAGQVDVYLGNASITTQGKDAHGIFAQSVGGGGGSGGFSISVSAGTGFNAALSFGGSGGSGGSAEAVHVYTGAGSQITTHESHSYGILAQSIGGGGGDGGFSIAGSFSVGGMGASLSFGGSGGVAGEGKAVTLNSQSNVTTSGDDSHAVFAQSVGGGGGSGGFSIAAGISVGAAVNLSFGGNAGGGGAAGSVDLTSTNGAIRTGGDHAYALLAQSIGGSGGDGGFSVSGAITAAPSLGFSMGGGGGTASAGGNVTLTNDHGSIFTTGKNSHAVFAQSLGGGGGSGGFSVAASISIDPTGGGAGAAVNASIGGTGGAGGDAGTVTVNSIAGTIVTGELFASGKAGNHSYGILAQSVGGGGGDGGFSVAGSISSGPAVSFSMGGNGGTAGIGGTVLVDSSTTITTHGNDSHALFAQSVGGGGGSGGFSVAGSISVENAAVGVSIGGKGAGGGKGGNVTVGYVTPITGTITTSGKRSNGILAQSVGGGGGDGGFSVAGNISQKAALGFSMGGGGGTASNGGIVILNSAALIQTGGSDSNAIFAQSVGGGGGNGGFSANLSVSVESAAIGASVGGYAGGGGMGGSVTATSTGSTLGTAGNFSNGILAQSVGGGGGTGGFSLAGGVSDSASVNASVGGSGGAGGGGSAVTVNSSSNITTTGQVSHGILAQSVGGGGGSGGFSIAGSVSAASHGVSFSMGGSGGVAGGGGVVDVTNSGAITTGNGAAKDGKGSYGILAQSVGGGGGTGGFSGAFTATLGEEKGNGLSVSVGGGGGTGGAALGVTIGNTGAVTTRADDSVGLFAQSIGGGGGNGGFSLSAALSAGQEKAAVSVSIGGGGGSGGTASAVTVTNGSQIQTSGAHSQGILAQSIGGGGGSGGFSIALGIESGDKAKSLAVSVGGAGGTGLGANLVTVTNTAAITTLGNDSPGIQAQSIGGGGGNGGFSVTGSMAGKEGKSLGVAVGGAGGTGGVGGEVDVFGTGGANSIGTSGDRSHGIFAQSIGGGGGNGGFAATVALGKGGPEADKPSTSIAVAVGGGGGTGETAGNVYVGKAVNVITGNITTSGQDAVGIFAQSVGGGGGTGGFSLAGSINLAAGQEGPNNNIAVSVGGKGGNGNNGGTVEIHHSGSIQTDGDGSHGIQAQSIGGGGGNGGSARAFTLQLGPKPPEDQKAAGAKNKALSLAIGGNGGGASNGGAVTVLNTGNITTTGGDAYGIFAQSIGGGGGNGGDAHQGIPGSLLLKKYDRAKFTKNLKIVVGGSGGSSGSGEVVDVTNTGNITTYGDGSHAVFAQSVGGGGGAGGAGDVGLLGTIGIGGATNSTGNGGAVNVTINGNIDTYGNGANGIFAQSIGGGGGAGGNVDRGLKNYLNVGIGLAFGQGGGNGGDGGVVTIQSTGDITTRGTGSSGIFAQSIGGGGGIVGSLGNDLPVLSVLNFAGSVGGAGSAGVVNVTHIGNIMTLGDASDGIFAQSAGGLNLGRAVNVTVTGDILASGAESNGIFGQSRGNAGAGDIDVQIMSGIVQGGTGTGAGVFFKDGKDNKLTNHGTVQTLAGMGGNSIFGGDGNETVDNFGTVNDSLDLGTGTNTFNNKTGGLLQSGDFIKLGLTNAFNNAGTISPGGVGTLQTTTLTGDFVENGNSIWNFDINAALASDLFAISGTANLGSFVNTVNLNALGLPAAGGTWTLITAPSDLTGTFKFGTLTGTGGVMPVGYTFTLVNSPTDEKLTMAPSTGPFYWRGAVSNAWNGSFVNGEANWTLDAAGGTFIFGTPAAVCDVFIATTNATLANLATVLGADFAINSLTFTGPNAMSIGGANTLTIEASAGTGITIDPGAGAATITANITLGGSQSWTNSSGSLFTVSGSTVTGSGKNLTIDGTGDTRISAAIQTGSGALTKDGTGTLTLSGTNIFTGNATVNNGTLSLQNGAAIADSVAVTVTAPGTLNLLDSETIGSLAGSGLATLNAKTLSTGGNDGTTTFSGTISGTGGDLVKEGTGTFTLTGPNSYTAGTTITAGTLRLGDGITRGAALGTGDVDIRAGATLTFDLANGETFSNFITNNGHVIADDVPPSDYTIASVMTGSGDFTKIGINTVTVTGTNSYTGGTTLVEGTLVAGNPKAFGSGNLTMQGGTLKTTGGPLSVNIGAGNILFSGGTYQANVGGTTPVAQHDQIVTTGSANISGGTFALVQRNGYLLLPGDKVVLISATGGVAGGSANGTPVPASHVAGLAAFSNTPLMIPTVNIFPKSVVFEAMQGSFAALSGVLAYTPNQNSVSVALDSLLPITGGHTGIFKELNYLDTQPLGTLKGNLDKISPEELTSVFQLAKSLANVQATNIERRLEDIRAEAGDAVPINSVNILIGGSQSVSRKTALRDDERWGMWFTGSGEFTHIGSTTNAAGYNLDSGGLTAGVDYRFTDHFAAGISIGYMNTTAALSNGGKMDVDGGRVGAYATYFDRGFHADFAVSGGPNSYKTRRTTPNNTFATGSPEGTEVNLLLATGYDWKKGGLTFGPIASFQYTNTQLDGFTERGAFAPLSVIRRNADSARSALGFKASYDMKVGRAIIRPEVRAAWQHEFGDTSYSLTSTFATLGGNAFTVFGPATGRDSLLVGAGVSIHWNDRFSTSVFYDGELLRKNYSSNNVSVGFRWRF